MNGECTDSGAVDAEDCRRHGTPYWYGALASVTVAAAVSALLFRGDPEKSIAVQTACLFVALAWVVVAGRHAWRPRSSLRLRPEHWVPGVALVTVACLLRYRMLSYLPLPDRTGFEELQMGSDAYKVLTDLILPLEFRFTKALAAVGLAWGGPTVEALRLPFQVMGYAKLAVLYLCLRGLGVSWWPSAFVTITGAVSRWFVIAGGVAYEDFSPTLILLLLVWCLIRSDRAGTGAPAWAAAAGVFSGVLMFENSSFRFAIVLAGGWLVWQALRAQGRVEIKGLERWGPVALFVMMWGLVAAPMLADVLHAGRGSIFFEAVSRYAKGRSGMLAPMAWENLRESFAMLAGRPMRTGSLLAQAAGQAVHPLTGALFALAALVGLFRPGKPIVRALVLAAVLATVACSVTTNDFQPTRLSPVVSIMLLPVGVLLEGIWRLVERAASRFAPAAGLPVDDHFQRERPGAPGIGVAMAVACAALSVFIVQASAARIGRMAGHRSTWREYSNDQYVTARYLANEATPGGQVLVVTPGLERDWSKQSIAYWVYAGKRLQVAGVQKLPRPEAITVGTLVVMGSEGRALRVEEVDRLRALASETDCLDTFDVYRGRGDRILVASFCVGCGASASASGTR
jgi:hypothetical protein